MSNKEKKSYDLKVTKKHWERTSREAFKNDPIRLIIEIIKNSVDSYTANKIKAPHKIWIEVQNNKQRDSRPYVKIRDNAMGMSSEGLNKALEYGAETSFLLNAVTSAEKGIGLKDVLIAMNPGKIATIHDDKYNETIITLIDTAKVREIEKDKKVIWTMRERLKIPKNGTIVSGRMPDYFFKHFDAIGNNLKNHFILRKILQKEEIEIILINCTSSGKILEQKHLARKEIVGVEKLNEEFIIPFKDKHGNDQIKVNLIIKKANKNLPVEEKGLLFYYGEYSVVDITLLDYQNDPVANNIFGEVYFEGEKIIREPRQEIIVDEKRRGLDKRHPFVKELFEEVNKRLGKIIEQEREISEYSFNKNEKKKILKDLNKLAKKLHGKGETPSYQPKIQPKTMAFSPPSIDILECETRSAWLVINKKLLTKGAEILIKTSTLKASFSPQKIEFKEQDLLEIKDNFVVKEIRITGKEKANGTIIAQIDKIEAELGVQIIDNPMFSPKNGFEFMPPEHKTTVMNGGEKKLNLIIKNKLITSKNDYLKDIIVRSTNAKNIKVNKNINKLEKQKIRNITVVKVPIVGGAVGETGDIIASYKNKEAKIKVKVVSSAMSGFFKDIQQSKEGDLKVTHFDENQGILFFYIDHPLTKKYMKPKNFSKKDDFLIFITDAIAREAIKALVEGGIKNNSSRYPIINPKKASKREIQHFIDRDYYDNGVAIHKSLKSFLKTMKL